MAIGPNQTFSLLQAGTTLQMLDAFGTVSTLTLPTGITLDDSKAPRFAVFDDFVVVTNTPSRPITVDASGNVKPLCLLPPSTAPILTTAAGGTLTGTYTVKTTFVSLDEFGNIVSESDYGPGSNSQAVTAQYLRATDVPVSLDGISARRLYRTTTGGAVYFEWIDLDGNTLTNVQDDLSDAGLSLFAAPVLGTCPHLTLIAEWRGRLWGVGDKDIDRVRYTETGVMYAWPSDNAILVPPQGGDLVGLTALMPRREELGVARLNQLAKVTGTGADTSTGDTDLSLVIVSRETGVLSQDSCALYRDQWYFLWYDGVYRWDSNGVTCLSDGGRDIYGKATGKGQVRSWFVTDNYFNRSRFPFAFGFIDTTRYKYVLFLAAAGSSVENRWIEYDLIDGTWWGPHKSDFFNPTCAYSIIDWQNKVVPIIGSSNAQVYEPKNVNGPTADDHNDSSNRTPIAFDVVGKGHNMDVPDLEKYFGQISMFGKAQPAGNLTVKSFTGEIATATDFVQTYDMTKTRQRLGRLGVGKSAQVELLNSEPDHDVEIWGYEINPVNVIGRR